MTKKEFLNEIRDGYYELQTATLENFCQMFKKVHPIFGEQKTKIEKIEDGSTKISFIDEDIYDSCIDAKGEEINEVVDMSTVALTLYINEDNVVNTIEHGLSIFTPANKDLILFYGSLVGKRIEL